jgi:hypothetical protein
VAVRTFREPAFKTGLFLWMFFNSCWVCCIVLLRRCSKYAANLVCDASSL